MEIREFYEARAIELLQELWETQDKRYISFPEELKEKYGVVMTPKALRNLFFREHKQFAQIMLLLDAMGVEYLEIPKHEKFHGKAARPGKALTARDLGRQADHPLKR
jgi:hypothetical protein